MKLELRRRPGTVGLMILFVCTGNTCRSAMAAALYRDQLAKVDEGRPILEVVSAGTDVNSVGGPATPEAVQALAERGIDLSDHQARPVDNTLLTEADLVVVMTRRQEAAVGTLEATVRPRTFLFGEAARLAGTVGPRQDRTFREWVESLASARGGHFTGGRIVDEVLDPWGGTADDYRLCADRLDGFCSALARLLI